MKTRIKIRYFNEICDKKGLERVLFYYMGELLYRIKIEISVKNKFDN